MTKIAGPFLVMTLAVVATAQAQSADRDALVAEVRLLRQAVERQTTLLVRAQLQASRLMIQAERVGRAQSAVDRAAEALDAAEWQQGLARDAVATTERAGASSVDAPRRSGLEREAEVLRARLLDQDKDVSRLRTRRQQAEQALEAELRSYAQQEAALGSVEQQAPRPRP